MKMFDDRKHSSILRKATDDPVRIGDLALCEKASKPWAPIGAYCLIYECYPDGALAAVDPIST